MRPSPEFVQISPSLRYRLLMDYKFYTEYGARMCKSHLEVDNWWPLVKQIQTPVAQDDFEKVTNLMFDFNRKFDQEGKPKTLFDFDAPDFDWIDDTTFKRGFRDVKVKLEELGFSVKMPAFCTGKQLETLEANLTRTVTKVRWIVEHTFGKFKKRFKFFAIPAHNGTLQHDFECVQVGFALMNMFFEPVYGDLVHHDVANVMRQRLHMPNVLKPLVEALNLTQKQVAFQPLEDRSHAIETLFPALTSEQLFDISLGKYQQKNAVSYVAEHQASHGGTFFVTILCVYVLAAIPLTEPGIHVCAIDYSPLLGGFAVVLSDGRAAFLTASTLHFDPNQMQGIWATRLDDAICTAVNHKYRLIAYGRRNSRGIIYCIDEETGALQESHTLVLSEKDYSGPPRPVSLLCWCPDGSVLAMTWKGGGFALWSVFGSLLMSSLAWDYGSHVSFTQHPFDVISLEWGTEGYTLWMACRENAMQSTSTSVSTTNPYTGGGGLLMIPPSHQFHNHQINQHYQYLYEVYQFQMVKSALTVNPAMCYQERLLLQGEDRIYINANESLTKSGSEKVIQHLPVYVESRDEVFTPKTQLPPSQVGNKQWIVVSIPYTYTSTNWPIRYTALDASGHNLAVAGRLGIAHYSLQSRKWKLFGSENQERDFLVTGGLLWYREHIVLGCYNIPHKQDELRFYPRDLKLSNGNARIVKLESQVIVLSLHQDTLAVYGADNLMRIFGISSSDSGVHLEQYQSLNLAPLVFHPACVVSMALTSIRTDMSRHHSSGSSNSGPGSSRVEGIILNISGRLMLLPVELGSPDPDDYDDFGRVTAGLPTVLASCVENVWLPGWKSGVKPHLTESLWLHCGAMGMRVWLPLLPHQGDKAFMAKRIMIQAPVSIYPLAVLYEAAVVLGVETDTILFPQQTTSHAPKLPFCVLERTSEVYLQHVLRQLLRRNLGLPAWEIARTCSSLPYFPHALELLLHKVVEEE
ncbi:unnamed protein product, partial [Darwinula stevensoni]